MFISKKEFDKLRGTINSNIAIANEREKELREKLDLLASHLGLKFEKEDYIERHTHLTSLLSGELVEVEDSKKISQRWILTKKGKK